jgi:hypothetical protein
METTSDDKRFLYINSPYFYQTGLAHVLIDQTISLLDPASQIVCESGSMIFQRTFSGVSSKMSMSAAL